MSRKTHNSTRRFVTSRNPSNGTEKPRTELSAGGLAFKRTPRGIFFAMVKDSYGKWTFPKGHVKRGESNDVAAIREVREEVGLRELRLVKSLGKIDIWFRDRYVHKGKLIHKFIYYFLLEAPAHARLRQPKIVKHGEKIRDVSWIPATELVKRSNYKDMKPIIKNAMAFLTEKNLM